MSLYHVLLGAVVALDAGTDDEAKSEAEKRLRIACAGIGLSLVSAGAKNALRNPVTHEAALPHPKAAPGRFYARRQIQP